MAWLRYHCRQPVIWLIGVAMCMNGCGYPEVSGKTYEIANALYNASNRRSVEHIDKALAVIEEQLAAGEISGQEAEWLRAIAEQARSGDWEGAAAESRSLIADQVRNGP